MVPFVLHGQLRFLPGQCGRLPIPHNFNAIIPWHCVLCLPAGQGGRYRGYNVAPAKGLCLQHVFYDPRVDDPRCAVQRRALPYTDVQTRSLAHTCLCRGAWSAKCSVLQQS